MIFIVATHNYEDNYICLFVCFFLFDGGPAIWSGLVKIAVKKTKNRTFDAMQHSADVNSRGTVSYKINFTPDLIPTLKLTRRQFDNSRHVFFVLHSGLALGFVS